MSSFSNRIRRHWTDPVSHHRRIAASFLLVSFFVLVGKLAGAAKEMAVAWRYGVSETVDAYVFIFNLINWPVGVWFSVLTMVLVPLVAKVRSDNLASLPRFRGELLGLTLLVGAGLGGLACLGLPLLLNTGWAGLSSRALQQSMSMVGPLSLLLPLGLSISLFSAWMMACGRHRNTLLEALPALAILIALLLPGWVPEPLVWGSVAGFALQLAGLGWALRREGELQRPALGFQSPAWHGFWGSVGVMAIGQALMSLTSIIDQFFAAHLGPGAISTLSYANRIMALILGLGAMAISRATLPIFSEVAAKGDAAAIRGLAMRWANWMFVFGLVVTVVMWLLAPWIVELLFQRGAFTANDTDSVSMILKYLEFQIPFYFSSLVLVSALCSRRQFRVISVIAASNLLIKIVFLYSHVNNMSLPYIAASICLMYACSTIMCLAALVKV